MKINRTIEENIKFVANLKVGNIIQFYTCCNADRNRLEGKVCHDDGLGLITIVEGVKYEIRKLIDIELINDSRECQLDRLPTEVQSILNSFNEEEELYSECKRIQQELNFIGWDCGYDLSGEITDIYQLKVIDTYKCINELCSIQTKINNSSKTAVLLQETGKDFRLIHNGELHTYTPKYL